MGKKAPNPPPPKGLKKPLPPPAPPKRRGTNKAGHSWSPPPPPQWPEDVVIYKEGDCTMHPRTTLKTYDKEEQIVDETVVRVTFNKWIRGAIILGGFSLLGLFLIEFFKLGV